VRELDATNDRRFMAPGEEALWPVFKGSSFNIWMADTGERYASADPGVVVPVLRERRRTGSRNRRSAFHEMPQDWIDDPTSLPCLHPRVAFREIARATDTRTVIAALVPPNVVLTHKAPYLLFPSGEKRDEAFLLGLLCSIPLDWYARCLVENGVSFFLFSSFPNPDPGRAHPLRRRVEEIAGRLASVDERYAEWAAAVGVPVGSVTTEEEKQELVAELDACVALLYGLDERQLGHVFETFHPTWDYEPRLERVLAHFHRLVPAEAVA
jgi:hypothetical protein